MSDIFLKDHLDLLEDAEACDYLTPKEEDFLQSLRDQHDQYGDGCFVSNKQLNWLENIAEKG